MKSMLLTATAFLCYTILYCQDAAFSFRHLDESDGLLSTLITGTVQDSSGFMWIATANGLQRYDGYRFISYRHNAGDAQSLSSNIVEQVVVDKYNNVYALTSDANIWLLNRDKNIFLNIASATHKSTNSVLSVSAAGELYITSYNCICKYNNSEKKTDTIVHLESNNNFYFTCAMQVDAKDNVYWIGTNKGLCYYDLVTKKLMLCDGSPNRFGISFSYYTTNIYLASNENLWISSYIKNISRYDVNTKHLYNYNAALFQHSSATGNFSANCFCEDKLHRIWIATSNAGLVLFNPSSNNFTTFTYQASNPQSVNYASDIYNVTTDRQGNIWIAADRGISYFTSSDNTLKNVSGKDFPNALVTSFLKSNDGKIWITTFGGGVVVCDSNLQVVHVFTSNKKNVSPFAPGNQFWSLAEDASSNIWIGGQSGALSVYNPATQKFTNISSALFHNKTIRTMRSDGLHNIWLGLQDGNVVEWSNSKKRFISFDSLLLAAHFYNGACNDIFVDGNYVWLASDHYGLLRMDTSGISVTQFIPHDEKDNSSDSTVICINAFSKNVLSVGTMNNGVYLFNTTTNLFTRLQPVNGDFNAFIAGVSSPVNAHIWVASYSSISSFDINNFKLTNYSEKNRTTSNVYTSKIYLINKKLFAGNDAGFTVIDPFTSTTIKPGTVAITGVSVFNQPLPIDSILQHHDALHLSYKQNFLRLFFASPAYFQTHALTYVYKLTDVDPVWRATSNPEVNYTELKGGNYTFNVYCENENGERGPVTTFNIIIQPPFWQTTLFYGLLACFVLMIVTGFYYYRIKQVRKKEREKNETQNQIQEMKLTILRTQLNPHFMFNSLNAIHNFILNNNQEQATIYLSKFAKLMRMVLDTSHQTLIPLQEEADMLNLYIELENLRLNDSIAYTFSAEGGINMLETMVPPLLLQPCIENAIWHGLMYKPDNRKLSFSVKKENNQLCFYVEDNGIGRQKATEIKSMRNTKQHSKGILLVEERLLLAGKQMNKASSIKIIDLMNEDGSAAGTQIIVCLPFIKTSYDGRNN